jgi:hypothetical protein
VILQYSGNPSFFSTIDDFKFIALDLNSLSLRLMQEFFIE